MSTQGKSRRRSPNKVKDGKKKCAKCGEVKPVDDFPKRKYVRQDGTVTEYPAFRCKHCESEYNRNYCRGNVRLHDIRRITRAATGKTTKPRGSNLKYRNPRRRQNVKAVDASKFFEYLDEIQVDYVKLFRGFGEDPAQLRAARRRNMISPRLADKVLIELGQPHMMKVLDIE